jgi:hypothetical protein
MAAVEIIETHPIEGMFVRPTLRLVTTASVINPVRAGRPLAERRAARARMMRRRRRTLAALALLASLTVLAWPGHAFGGTTGAGLSSDLADSLVLASGTSYVVAPGDTVQSIAAMMNPVDPSLARRALVSELRTSALVVGEHVLIP